MSLNCLPSPGGAPADSVLDLDPTTEASNTADAVSEQTEPPEAAGAVQNIGVVRVGELELDEGKGGPPDEHHPGSDHGPCCCFLCILCCPFMCFRGACRVLTCYCCCNLLHSSDPPAPTAAEVGHPPDTGHPGGSGVIGAAEASEILRSDEYDLELLLSFGRGHVNSAGHMALCVRDGDSERVYSANFYADGEHDGDGKHCSTPLVLEIDRDEYLWATEQPSQYEPGLEFGTDYGECYARSVLGVRFTGVPAAARGAIRDWVAEANRKHADGELVYDYTGVNCAFVGGSLMQAAGFEIDITEATGAISCNIPIQIALDCVKFAMKKDITVHSSLYKKYAHSTYSPDPANSVLEFKDSRNCFPSFRSFDFLNDEDEYEAWCNLNAIHLFHKLRKWTVSVDDDIRTLEVTHEQPEILAEAMEQAEKDAHKEAKHVLQRVVRVLGFKASSSTDLGELYWG